MHKFLWAFFGATKLQKKTKKRCRKSYKSLKIHKTFAQHERGWLGEGRGREREAGRMKHFPTTTIIMIMTTFKRTHCVAACSLFKCKNLRFIALHIMPSNIVSFNAIQVLWHKYISFIHSFIHSCSYEPRKNMQFSRKAFR